MEDKEKERPFISGFDEIMGCIFWIVMILIGISGCTGGILYLIRG